MNGIIVFIATQVLSTEVFVGVIALVVLDLFRRGYTHAAVCIALSTVFMMLSVTVLKEIFMIPRPAWALVSLDSYAFPSGHGAGVMFLAGVLYYYARLVLRTRTIVIMSVLTALVFVVGASRVYLGVHTPLQVFAGYMLGALWVGVFFAVLQKRKSTKSGTDE